MMIETWTQKLHDLDHQGTLQFTADDGEHYLAYEQWWENCGETGETFRCSCGFRSTEHQGNGCWQQGHNVASQHEPIDRAHAALIIAALEKAQACGLGYPAELRGLAMLAIQDIGKGPGTMGLLKRAMRIA